MAMEAPSADLPVAAPGLPAPSAESQSSLVEASTTPLDQSTMSEHKRDHAYSEHLNALLAEPRSRLDGSAVKTSTTPPKDSTVSVHKKEEPRSRARTAACNLSPVSQIVHDRSYSLVGEEHTIVFRDRPGKGLPSSLPSSIKGGDRKHYWYHQDAHANLLTRELEAVSVVATADFVMSLHSDCHVQLLNPRILVVSYQKEDLPCSHSHCAVDTAVDLPALDASAGVVRAVLREHTSNNGQVPLKTHVGWYFGLLRACHQPGLLAEASSIAMKNLQRYVYLVSAPKMLLRAGLGMDKSGSNFFSVLTSDIDNFAIGGTFEMAIQPADLSKLMPTTKQAEFIGQFWFETLPRTEFSIEERFTIARMRARAPLYDLEGRKRFHQMLRTLLYNVARVLYQHHVAWRGLQDFWKNADKSEEPSLKKETARKSNMDHTEYLINYIERVVERAQIDIPVLTGLLHYFGSGTQSLLEFHLAWLASVALTGTTSTCTTRLQKVAGRSGSDLDRALARFSQTGGDKAGLPYEFHDLLNVPPSTKEWNDQDWTTDWAKGAFRYMRSICLDGTSLLIAKPTERIRHRDIQSAHILESSVTVVDIRYCPTSSEMTPTKSIQFLSKGPVAVNRAALEYAFEKINVPPGLLRDIECKTARPTSHNSDGSQEPLDELTSPSTKQKKSSRLPSHKSLNQTNPNTLPPTPHHPESANIPAERPHDQLTPTSTSTPSPNHPSSLNNDICENPPISARHSSTSPLRTPKRTTTYEGDSPNKKRA